MLQVPTKRQSILGVILGAIFLFVGIIIFFMSLSSGRYGMPDGTLVLTSILTFVFGIVMISLGYRKVVDMDRFSLFLRDFIKIEVEKL